MVQEFAPPAERQRLAELESAIITPPKKFSPPTKSGIITRTAKLSEQLTQLSERYEELRDKIRGTHATGLDKIKKEPSADGMPGLLDVMERNASNLQRLADELHEMF
jgi:hypothetical protein